MLPCSERLLHASPHWRSLDRPSQRTSGYEDVNIARQIFHAVASDWAGLDPISALLERPHANAHQTLGFEDVFKHFQLKLRRRNSPEISTIVLLIWKTISIRDLPISQITALRPRIADQPAHDGPGSEACMAAEHHETKTPVELDDENSQRAQQCR